MVCYCEQRNKTLDSIKDGEFLDLPSNLTPQIYLVGCVGKAVYSENQVTPIKTAGDMSSSWYSFYCPVRGYNTSSWFCTSEINSTNSTILTNYYNNTPNIYLV